MSLPFPEGDGQCSRVHVSQSCTQLLLGCAGLQFICEWAEDTKELSGMCITDTHQEDLRAIEGMESHYHLVGTDSWWNTSWKATLWPISFSITRLFHQKRPKFIILPSGTDFLLCRAALGVHFDYCTCVIGKMSFTFWKYLATFRDKPIHGIVGEEWIHQPYPLWMLKSPK